MERGTAVWVELQHFNRVAEVEVEDLIRIENVHFGKRSRLEQVIDRGALGTHAAGQIDGSGRGVRPAIEAALHWMRFEPKQTLDLISGHHHKC